MSIARHGLFLLLLLLCSSMVIAGSGDRQSMALTETDSNSFYTFGGYNLGEVHYTGDYEDALITINVQTSDTVEYIEVVIHYDSVVFGGQSSLGFSYPFGCIDTTGLDVHWDVFAPGYVEVTFQSASGMYFDQPTPIFGLFTTDVIPGYGTGVPPCLPDPLEFTFVDTLDYQNIIDFKTGGIAFPLQEPNQTEMVGYGTFYLGFPGPYESWIGDTVYVPAVAYADFLVDNGFSLEIGYDTSEVTYVGATLEGGFLEGTGCTLTDTTYGPYVNVAGSGIWFIPDNDTLFFFKFYLDPEKMTGDNHHAIVNQLDTYLNTQCPAIGFYTNYAGFMQVGSYKYQATIKFVDKTVILAKPPQDQWIDDLWFEILTNFPINTCEINAGDGIRFTQDMCSADSTVVSDFDYYNSAQFGVGQTIYWADEVDQSGCLKTYREPINETSDCYDAGDEFQSLLELKAFALAAGVEDSALVDLVNDPSSNTDVRLKPLYVDWYVTDSTRITLIDGWIKLDTANTPSGGCPFVYTFDGRTYVRDNTILTASQGMIAPKPIVDHYLLQTPVSEADGEVHLLLKEFEQEQSHFDRVELLAVDFPESGEIGVSPKGDIVLYGQKIAPFEAVDDAGHNIVDMVNSDDGSYYTASGSGYIIMTYYNPQAKYGGSGFALAQDQGDGSIKPKRDQKLAYGPDTDDLPYGMEVEDVVGQWHRLPVVPSREEQATNVNYFDEGRYTLGSTFRVKIFFDDGLNIDDASLRLTSRDEVRTTPLKLVSATHQVDGDITDVLQNDDNVRAMMIPDESIELSYEASSPDPGMTRRYVLRTTGYYEPYDENGALPNRFALHRNKPNPFNPSTIISYTLPTAAQVKLEIFNVLGQRVAVLTDEYQDAGTYEVTWEGRDDRGEQVASGVYFYRIKAGDKEASRKMMLMK